MIQRWLFPLIFLLAASHAEIPEKVLICGVCKDVAKRLPRTIKIMEHIGSLFEDYRIIVYENNSSDKTPILLQRWARKNSRVSYQSEKLSREELNAIIINVNDKGEFFRPELIARARNIVLGKALSKAYEGFDTLIWMDMDFVLAPDYEGIVEVFQEKREWDAVLAYGIDPKGIYWDWYAFRDDVYPLGSELLGNRWWAIDKNFSPSPQDDWFPVYSAFGGCGIYKKSSVIDCRYSALVNEDLESIAKRIIDAQAKNPLVIEYLAGLDNTKKPFLLAPQAPGLPRFENPSNGFVLSDDPEAIIWRMSTFFYQYPTVCEHVPFHASMIARGHDKIFINPRMIFRYGR